MTTVPLGVLIALGVVITVVGYPSLGLALAIAGAAVLVMTRSRALIRWFTDRQARSVLGLKQRIVITDSGIQYESPLAKGEIPWAAVTEVRANERTVAFVRDRLLIAYIPTSAFASSADREQIVSYARARIAGSRPARAT